MLAVAPIEDQRRWANAQTIDHLPWRRADAFCIEELETKRTRRISYALSVGEVLTVGADASSIQVYLSLMGAVTDTVFIHRLSRWTRAFSILVGKYTHEAYANFVIIREDLASRAITFSIDIRRVSCASTYTISTLTFPDLAQRTGTHS